MSEKNARQIIEALRSGIPSMAVGSYFTEARPAIQAKIDMALEACANDSKSTGMIIKGRYGEGKTHLLNTVISMAHQRNMVVSFIPLSKEVPFDKLYQIYQRLMNNTYLPNRVQPGFTYEFEQKMKDTAFVNDLILFANTELERNRISYVMRAYKSAKEDDQRFLLQSDLMGDFISQQDLRKIYRGIYKEPAKFNENFKKKEHTSDYFEFMSYVFERMGYHGWVLLFDEAELTGRLGKKARLNAYRNMDMFLAPTKKLHSVFSLFAFTSSFDEDVIEGKREFENLNEVYPDNSEPMKTVLNRIVKAPELAPLRQKEIEQILEGIIHLHGQAYGWQPGTNAELLGCKISHSGFLLRTKLRAAIEYLDQLYLYGDEEQITTGQLDQETYEEETVSLTELQ